MDFGRAVGVAFTTGSNRRRKEGEVDETEQVTWGHALIGIAILVVIQLVLIFWTMGASLDEGLIRVSILSFVPLAVPFLVFWLGALATRTMARLPAAFLYLGIALAVIQVVSAIFASFGPGKSAPVLGVFLAFNFLAARGFLKLGWGPAVLVSLLAVGGLLGVTFLLITSLGMFPQ
jgi:hypothetical protein